MLSTVTTTTSRCWFLRKTSLGRGLPAQGLCCVCLLHLSRKGKYMQRNDDELSLPGDAIGAAAVAQLHRMQDEALCISGC